MRVDPAHAVKARELRDRYLEQFNDPVNGGMILPSGKYAVCRQIGATPAGFVAPPPLLEQRAA
jgi:hypothetical protein